MSQAPRSQNEITNVVKKFPGLFSWVEKINERVKELEAAAADTVSTTVESVKTVAVEEFDKLSNKVTSFGKSIDDVSTEVKKIAVMGKDLFSLKKEIDNLKEKVKTTEDKVKTLEKKIVDLEKPSKN